MKTKKIVLLSIISILIIVSLGLYLNRDKFAYVGTVKIIEVDCLKKAEILDEVYDSD